jgi:hypothetical protein
MVPLISEEPSEAKPRENVSRTDEAVYIPPSMTMKVHFAVLYENVPGGEGEGEGEEEFVKLRGIEGTFSRTINSPRIYSRLPTLLSTPH